LYLIFNEGYLASAGDRLMRADLAAEALRLARALVALLDADPRLAPSLAAEPLGLLALMLLHHARRRARLDPAGEFISLDDQDRSLWDAALIAEDLAVLDRALALRRSGPYQLEAAISALHARALAAADTDWLQIAALYGELARRQMHDLHHGRHRVRVTSAAGVDRDLIAWLRAACHQA
jgi:RNA polymerase sigma-70 factor (ECF subfamily)